MQDLRLYLRLLQFAYPYRAIAGVSILAMICSAALEPVLPGLMQPLVDKGLIAKDLRSAWQVPFFIVLTFFVKGVADYAATLSTQYIAQRTIADLRQLVYGHALDLPMSRHEGEQQGRMLSRITNDIEMVADAVSSAWLILIRDSMVLIGLLGFLLYTAWQLALVVFLIAPMLAFAIRRFSGRIRSSNRHLQTWSGRLNSFITESLMGLREIKIFGGHQQQSELFFQINKSLRHERMRLARIQALNVPIVQVLAALAVATVVYAAFFLSKENMLTPGEFVSFITAMSMVFEPIRRITNVNAVLQRGLAGAESIFGLLDEAPERQIVSVSGFIKASQPANSGVHVSLRRVGFQYSGRESPVISDFSLEVKSGESVAIVGPSGSGKSTLMAMIAGFITPNSGEIYFDDEPLSEMSIQQRRSKIALVGQRVNLFDRTIFENVAMGRPGVSREAVVEALKFANAYEFVEKLPDGLETSLGGFGDRLSGGQRQRIAIARAILKNAPLVLLDEPTSALDKQSEQEVLRGLSSLLRGRTVIWISHSPDALIDCSRMIRL